MCYQIMLLFPVLLIISTSGENCEDIKCSHIFDEVCGMAELRDGTQFIMRYKNLCFMKVKECELRSLMGSLNVLSIFILFI